GAGAHDDQGRPQVLIRRGGQCAGEGHPRQPHDPDRARAPGIRLGAQQGLRRTRAPGGAAGSWPVRRAPQELEHHRQHRPGRARPARGEGDGSRMSAEDLEKYETDMELQLYREYRDGVSRFSHVVEPERRFYLANEVDVQVRTGGGETWFEVTMTDAWVWDVFRPARFVKNVRVITFKDVNVEELAKS